MTGIGAASAAVDDATWRSSIERVITTGDVRLAVQPIVDLARSRIAGYEVLSRFTGPPETTPDVWFHAAERLGLGPQLDAAVIRRALELRDILPSDTFLSINLDPSHLNDDEVRTALTRSGGLERVVVELTEHTIIEDYDQILEHLALLRERGAKIAIDDAGSGYAGLQWLMSLSPDLVKLDRALIDRVDGDEVKIALISMLGAFADRIDASLIAEGLERMAELDTARRLGIPLGQGYLLGRPSFDRWPEIVGEVQSHMTSRNSVAIARTEALALVESATTRDLSVGRMPVTDATVILDDSQRPVALELPDGGRHAVLCVRSSEPLHAMLSRAMTRPLATRWTPLVCVDDERALIGIVRIERIVDFLMAQVTALTPIGDAI